MRARRPSGSVLIETLVALVLLAVAGTALVTFVGQTAVSMRDTAESERRTAAASDEMSQLSVLSRDELLAHGGRASHHGWTVQITLLSPGLFAASIATSDTTAPLVRTVLYRPIADSADGR